MSAHAQIEIRDTAILQLSPLPEHYEFLQNPTPRQKYRINFRHPAYAPDDNLLFTLHAWDHADGGIHYGLAHCACSIFADNRVDGYLSRSCNDEHGERIDAAWDDILPAADADYYFYVPDPSESTSSPSNASRTPYRWHVVTNFQDWQFPKVMHEVFTRCAGFQQTVSNIAAQSNWTAAIRQRDGTCRVTAFESGTEVAHLIPEHERQWFLANSMADWNNDQTLDSDHLLRDLDNAVLLRSDIHTAFDQRKFVFFPKGPKDFVVHMLAPTTDIGQLYHNTRVCFPQCSLAFLYSRFAWAIFPSLSKFLSRPGRSRLVVRTKADTGERVIEEVTNAILLAKRATASRSASPTKRSRAAAELGDCDIEHDQFKRNRTYQLSNSLSSSNSTPPTLDEDKGNQPRMSASYVETAHRIQSPTGFEVRESPDICSEQSRIQKLRREALEQQRPKGYIPWPKYDRHRPAREELEIMGVEIIDDDDSEE